MIYISPSLLAADFTKLGDEVKRIEEAGADYLHLDVMDGVFVPNISFGLPVIESLRKTCGLVFDVHLMITKPERYVERFANAGADIITFHVESDSPVKETIDKIKSLGVKAALSVKPKTPVEEVFPYLDSLDMVLIMTVEPGFGGQKFMPSSIAKCEYLAKKKQELSLHNLIIEVDGGISASNSRLLFDAGAEALVAGSSVFGAPDPEQAIVDMLNS